MYIGDLSWCYGVVCYVDVCSVGTDSEDKYPIGDNYHYYVHMACVHLWTDKQALIQLTLSVYSQVKTKTITPGVK